MFRFFLLAGVDLTLSCCYWSGGWIIYFCFFSSFLFCSSFCLIFCFRFITYERNPFGYQPKTLHYTQPAIFLGTESVGKTARHLPPNIHDSHDDPALFPYGFLLSLSGNDRGSLCFFVFHSVDALHFLLFLFLLCTGEEAMVCRANHLCLESITWNFEMVFFVWFVVREWVLCCRPFWYVCVCMSLWLLVPHRGVVMRCCNS